MYVDSVWTVRDKDKHVYQNAKLAKVFLHYTYCHCRCDLSSSPCVISNSAQSHISEKVKPTQVCRYINTFGQTVLLCHVFACYYCHLFA